MSELPTSPHESAGRSLASLVSSSLFHSVFRNIESELSALTLRGGQTLFTEGQPGDALYVVVFGRLRALRESHDGVQVLGEIGRGESVGEMALLTGEPRSATVRAIRNTKIIQLSKAGFERLAEQQPQVLLEIARLIATRYQHMISAPALSKAATFAVVPCDAAVPTAEITAGLVKALSPGAKVLAIDQGLLRRERPTIVTASPADLDDSELFGWLDAQELRHDHVVYSAEPSASPWTQLCLRQADIVLLVGSPGKSTTMDPALRALVGPDSESVHARTELVLLYDSSTQEPRGTSEWLTGLAVAAHHHVDPRQPHDYDRLARMLTGRAIGLVLGGGGARGLAHIGVIRALEEAGIPIDLVGGTSIGSLVAGQFACGWNSARIAAECRKAFIESGSLNDFTLPLISVLRGRRYVRAVGSIFGDRRIEDLPRTYFCVSTNLTRGESVPHRMGPMSKWVSASMAIPGLGPPFFDGLDVLVDGGVLNNLPVDVMRGLGRGPVFASSVSGSRGPRLSGEYADLPSPWRMLFNRLAGTTASLPGMASILIRATSMSNAVARARGYPGTDLVFEPPIEGYKLLDWRSLDQLVELGYQHAATKLEAWQSGRASPAAVNTTAMFRVLPH